MQELVPDTYVLIVEGFMGVVRLGFFSRMNTKLKQVNNDDGRLRIRTLI